MKAGLKVINQISSRAWKEVSLEENILVLELSLEERIETKDLCLLPEEVSFRAPRRTPLVFRTLIRQ